MENNLKAKVYTSVDLGMTDDEYNNMLIDIYVQGKQQRKQLFQTINLATGEIIESPTPTTITITLKGGNLYENN